MPDLASRPPIASANISLVLVACNVAAHIQTVVAAWTSQMDALARPYEIILVDDGSTDDTPALADTLTAHNNRLRVIHHATRVGFGAALQSGIAAAKHPLLAYTTGDAQYEPSELGRLLEKIDKVDLVTGQRLWLPVPRLLRWQGAIWRTFVRVLFGIPLEPLPCWLGEHGQWKRWFARWAFGVRVRDVECAFRLIRRTVVTRFPIQSHGPFAQVEILAKTNFMGCWMDEVPVSYHPPSGPALHGSLHPNDTYLGEARRLFSNASFHATGATLASRAAPAT
jgi:glycosyltransferase involved in cell wall biosynthesis